MKISFCCEEDGLIVCVPALALASFPVVVLVVGTGHCRRFWVSIGQDSI